MRKSFINFGFLIIYFTISKRQNILLTKMHSSSISYSRFKCVIHNLAGCGHHSCCLPFMTQLDRYAPLRLITIRSRVRSNLPLSPFLVALIRMDGSTFSCLYRAHIRWPFSVLLDVIQSV